jgi:hypothetical protein
MKKMILLNHRELLHYIGNDVGAGISRCTTMREKQLQGENIISLMKDSSNTSTWLLLYTI